MIEITPCPDSPSIAESRSDMKASLKSAEGPLTCQDWPTASPAWSTWTDTFLLKVNLDEVDPGLLKPYKANYLMVDFRYDSKFKNGSPVALTSRNGRKIREI
mgnify:CR=1 FL=1